MDAEPPPFGPALAAILDQGAYFIVRNFAGQGELLARARHLIEETVGRLRGAEARRILETGGLTLLHEALPAQEIAALRDHVMAELRPGLFGLAVRIARDLLGIRGEFFVDEYTILRVNYPYLVALQSPETAENPGIGRVGEATRELSRKTRVIDPVYAPKGYHKNEPPPAWAHGPHQDTWTGHSRLGVNLWWALDEVFAENSMVFFPETFGRAFVPDPRSLYLAEGQPLPKPSRMALRAGEMLIFNPEMLHGTHLNTTNRTRVAISTRINPRRPTFDPGCFYAREFWHSSAHLEAGDYDHVIRFEREKNLGRESVPANSAHPVSPPEVVPAGEARPDGWIRVCPGDRVPPGGKLLVRHGPQKVMLARGRQRLHAVQSHCSHLDVSLMDGFHDDDSVHCPAHALAFSLESGASSCPTLTLRTYAVREEDGWIHLHSRTPSEHEPTVIR